MLFRKIYLKIRAKKLSKYISYLEDSLKYLQIIENDEADKDRLVKSLLNSNFNDLVLNYEFKVQLINEHNNEVRTLIDSIDSLLLNYSKKSILDKIPEFNYENLEGIYDTIKRVYQYIIPESFPKKAQYDGYKKDVEELLHNYQDIVNQKNIVCLAKNLINELPDAYLDNVTASIVLNEARKLIDELKVYRIVYYEPPTIDSVTIDTHNKSFIERHLNDTIFDNVNGKSLDEEQRRAILCDAKSNLTIAGAGSGKTLTICGKVQYLLSRNLAQTNEILLLSYSRASADDLAIKVTDIDKNLDVETFHSLGFRILTSFIGKKKAVEDQLKSYVVRFFEEELIENPKIANEIFQYIALYFYSIPVEGKKYKNNGELFSDLKSIDFRTLKDQLSGLSENGYKHETLKKEYVKSNEELVIANYLFINGIQYEYERPYKFETSTLDKRQYVPDFYLPEYDIYIEHYGVNKKGEAPQYSSEAGEKYVQSMKWKRQIHKENGTKCLETYSYEFLEGTIFDSLRSKLKENNVRFDPLSQADIICALDSVYKGRDFSSFFNLIATFISLYKAQIKDDKGFEELRNQIKDGSYDTNRAHLFLDICQDIYRFYIQNLRAADKIDFDDMILQSTDLLDSVEDFKYKYIIVDEFQDISYSRASFLKKLIDHGNAKLFAVGDDWQAIYRFAGCDLNILLDFDKNFFGSKINYITTTHRNSMELQTIVEPFITANPSQYKKHIKSNKHQDNPVRIVYHNGDKVTAFTCALEDISRINPIAKVLVLGRNRHDIDAFIGKTIKLYNYRIIRHENFPNLEISYNTVHSSKGMEGEYVIIISGEDAPNGFPNKMEDDNLLSLLLGKKNNYEYAEERRLFYVALTRTKSIVYLLSEKDRRSKFIREIEKKCYILYDQNALEKESRYHCPLCEEGHLIIRRTKQGRIFYGCSNYPYCSYTNNDLEAVRKDIRCPVCGDFLIPRKGRYGTFLGCHNYPRCDYTRQNQQTH